MGNTESVRIVVLDGHTLNPGDLSWGPIEECGDLEVHDTTAEADVISRCRGANVVLTNKVALTEQHFAELPDLQLVSVLATGYDVIDVDAASRHEVTVCNVPSYATDSVAQHVFALLLELTNRVATHDEAVRAGEWTDANGFTFWRRPLSELVGKTLGVVGYGRIGRRVANIGLAFGMNPVVYSPSLNAGEVVQDARVVTLDEVFELSDVVSLNCALNDDNHHLVDARRLGLMKPDAVLINTARGALVDNDALAAALSEELIAGAAIDVVEGEPIDGDHPLLDVPNLVVTPHNAWTSRESRTRLMSTTAANIAAFLRGKPQNVL